MLSPSVLKNTFSNCKTDRLLCPAHWHDSTVLSEMSHHTACSLSQDSYFLVCSVPGIGDIYIWHTIIKKWYINISSSNYQNDPKKFHCYPHSWTNRGTHRLSNFLTFAQLVSGRVRSSNQYRALPQSLPLGHIAFQSEDTQLCKRTFQKSREWGSSLAFYIQLLVYFYFFKCLSRTSETHIYKDTFLILREIGQPLIPLTDISL